MNVSINNYFKNESIDKKVSMFVIIVLSLPVEQEDLAWCSESLKYSWNHSLIACIIKEWDIPEEYFNTYRVLIRTWDIEVTEHSTDDILNTFVSVISEPPLNILVKILIFLVTNSFYDGRGRTLLRNVCFSLKLSKDILLAVEITISHLLERIDEGKLNGKSSEDNESINYSRYMKIGAAGLGAGALLAVTGGLAAPAIAAALVAFGGTTAVAAAAFSTSTIMASLFGSAGAGLAGYKMVLYKLF
jgi:hypothetical protein